MMTIWLCWFWSFYRKFLITQPIGCDLILGISMGSFFLKSLPNSWFSWWICTSAFCNQTLKLVAVKEMKGSLLSTNIWMRWCACFANVLEEAMLTLPFVTFIMITHLLSFALWSLIPFLIKIWPRYLNIRKPTKQCTYYLKNFSKSIWS